MNPGFYERKETVTSERINIKKVIKTNYSILLDCKTLILLSKQTRTLFHPKIEKNLEKIKTKTHQQLHKSDRDNRHT